MTEKRLNGYIAIFSFGFFCMIINELGLIPALPYLSKSLGIDIAKAGSLISIYALVSALVGPFLTAFCMEFNRKKVLLVALFIIMIAQIISLFTNSFYILYAGRIIAACMYPIFFSLSFSYFNSVLEDAKKGRAFANMFLGGKIGLLLGLPGCAYLVTHFSFKSLFVFTLIANTLCFLLIYYFIPVLEHSKEKTSYKDQLKTFFHPHVLLGVALVITIFAACFVTYTYFPSYFKEIVRIPLKQSGNLLFAFGLAGILGNFIFGRALSHNIYRFMFVYLGCFLALELLIYLVGGAVYPFCFFFCLLGVFQNSNGLVTQFWLNKGMESFAAFMNSLMVSFANLGISLGSMVGGKVINNFGIKYLPLFAMVFLFIAALAVLGTRYLKLDKK